MKRREENGEEGELFWPWYGGTVGFEIVKQVENPQVAGMNIGDL